MGDSKLFDNMIDYEQYAAMVTDYSSRYNISKIYSYAPENLAGKPYKYPMYGDFPDTYMLRTYGKWWNNSKSAQKHYMPQDQEEIFAEDFISLRFDEAVVPRTIIIYETYNPGAVVRIWGRIHGDKWHVLWEETPTIHPQTSRKFTVGIQNYMGIIDELRLDFNQHLLSYYTGLDAVLLCGKKPRTILQSNLLRTGYLGVPRKEIIQQKYVYDDSKASYFSHLPDEIIIKIFSYLDLKSLSRCAQVNKTWSDLVNDPTIYRNLSLKKYWDKINNTVLISLIRKCRVLKKLDLSWCGESDTISEKVFMWFLEECCQNLTHLSLSHCVFAQKNSLQLIGRIETLTELRLRDSQINSWSNLLNDKLHNLETLDLSTTKITTEVLIGVLAQNAKLKHLNIDLCENLLTIDAITQTVATHNLELISWSSWKTHTMSVEGLELLSNCKKLEEINVGWCSIPQAAMVSPGVIEVICVNCTQLKRLILSGWRNVTNHSLIPIVYICRELTQLDLLGIKYISSDFCEKLLMSLKNLELLDVSFCELITSQDILRWRVSYPNVAIQRSCEHTIATQLSLNEFI
ncbi:F-box/LRR-repeat protein 4 [Onthophagus taurus]|uniref:F-box/LRR-repeat protein 4 n=1 Tax=Onthophagus taurus TaxID=166361 RepID=UPI000C203B66|nr:F-box/LRR-repeat protein 4 [Onthophagus taurus]